MYAMTPEKYVEANEKSAIDIEEEIQAKTEEILQKITIREPTTKIFAELARKEINKGNALDQSGEMENQVFEIDEDEEGHEKKKEVKQARKGDKTKRKCCWFCRKGAASDLTKKGKVNEENLIDSFYQLPQDTVHEEMGMFENVKEKVDSEVVGKYTHQHYLIDTAIRFYLSNVASIEINQ